ncbi:PTS sorbitol transporter subunit IIA [Ligilactobacillus pobuzihii]|uniref:PTS glucitol/sorbitol transporter subunit IIA n=1 Tax=Ligilactobacillus pobuzihii TaxID=449659 RepID=UPI0019D1EE70|nr:PTS glucitol/sorbitol transporter subunit IIA [Ligilactobacillus pobuzihii]MBN7274159.1 PTS sorbitol transporter subunit IIA [Ligilactobacillus pobuzihii]
MAKESLGKEIFATEVHEIGAEAKMFKDINMVILFGSAAPDALRPSCYIIDVTPVKGEIKKGMYLQINGHRYLITAVGGEVQTNLTNLGHIAITFDGSKEANLPGTLYIENAEYPNIEVGSKIRIVAD